MSQPTMRKYPAEFKERAVKLAVESDQPIAQTARDLGVNENTLHTWIGKYHTPPDSYETKTPLYRPGRKKAP